MSVRKREYSLDLVKIIATVLIVFHHYQQVTGVQFEKGINFNGGIFYFGYIVELFFILSGYFLYPYIRKIENGMRFKNFYFKRFIRIFPLLIIGAITYEIFLVIYQWLYQKTWFDIKPTFWGTVIASLGIQDGWALPNPSVNNPTWYISVLMLCYVIFYFIISISKRFKISVNYLFAFMIFLGMGINTYQINLPFLNGSSARGYYAFFFGLLLAEILNNYIFKSKYQLFSCMVLIIIPMLIIYKYSFMSTGINYIMTFIYYPALIIFFKSVFISKILNRQFIGTLGSISFNVYIWHNPFYILMYIIIKVFNWDLNLNSVYTMISYCIVCFIFGTFSHFCIEKPIGKIIEKKIVNLSGM